MRISKHFFCFFLLCTIVGQSNAQEWTSYKSIQGVSDYLDMGDELYLATDAGLVVVDKNTLEPPPRRARRVLAISERQPAPLELSTLEAASKTSAGRVAEAL